mmetsp:Transcript_12148/g.18222  ORF Transcript_12148/g.18222 Transcript_12148/m.18222 type:complete len:338 (+) Transcript_12148:90-1103(+)
MKSSTNDNSNVMSGAVTSTGLDLLFAASQLTTTSSGGADPNDHHRPSLPVNNVQYSYPPPRDAASTSNNQDVAAPSNNDGGDVYSPVVDNSAKSFVQLLMDILNVPDPDHASIICWVPDGKSFLIADQERFETELLPTYFRGSMFNSFVRKLNRWGFRRLKRTGHASSFAHDLFVRDKPWLCGRMRCQSKPNFKKVPTKVTDDVRQSAFDAATDVAIPPCVDVQHAAPSTSSGLYSNINVTQPLSTLQPPLSTTVPFDVTKIPSSPIEERLRRELLLASITQMQQRPLAQMPQLQMNPNQLQYLNNISALTDEALAPRYLQPSSMSQYTRDLLRRNN